MNIAETEAVFTAGLEPASNAAQRARAIRLVRENRRIPAELAVTIYGNNVSAALIKALTAAFPACRRILGEACFNAIAHRFIEHNPSTHADLNRYGASFGDFLDDWTATRAQFSDYRYLRDLARLEWHFHTAYTAADDPPFDFRALAEASRDTPDCREKLRPGTGPEAGLGHAGGRATHGAVAEETLRLQLSHSLRLLQSDYPVMEIRETNLSDGDATEVRADELPEYLVVSRPALQPRVERVDAVIFQLLAACQDGSTLGHITKPGKPLTNTLPETLTELIQRQWITGFTLDSVFTTREPVDA